MRPELDAQHVAEALFWMTERFLARYVHREPDESSDARLEALVEVYWAALYAGQRPTTRG